MDRQLAQQNYIAHISGTRNVKIKALVELVPGRPFQALQGPLFVSLYCGETLSLGSVSILLTILISVMRVLPSSCHYTAPFTPQHLLITVIV